MTANSRVRRAGRIVPGVVVGVVIVALLAGCDVYARSWSTIHGDAGNRDYAAIAGARDLTLAWQRSFEGSLTVGATVDTEGRVYVTGATPGCQLHALDGQTGETIWCSGEVDRFAVVSSPLLDHEGRIFVGDGQAMHAFDRDGNLLWERPIEGVPLSAQFTPNGRVLLITHLGQIQVLRRENGQPVLPAVELIPGAVFDPADGILGCGRGTADCPAANTLGMDLATGRFFFTFWEPGAPRAGLRAMRITEDPVPTLTPLWESDALPGGSASSPTISGDGTRVYVNDNVDAVHALDAVTGHVIWSQTIGFAPGGSPSLSPGGLIMPAGGGSSPLLAIQDDGATAHEVWRVPALVNRGIPTQADGGLSYATVSRGLLTNDLVVVDTATATVLDREPIPGFSVFTVGTTVGPDGTVYVPTVTGSLYAYRAA